MITEVAEGDVRAGDVAITEALVIGGAKKGP
jgi:hypothetical protein